MPVPPPSVGPQAPAAQTKTAWNSPCELVLPSEMHAPAAAVDVAWPRTSGSARS